MYAMRAVAAPIEIRTHEDGHLPSGVQPLQVALLREAVPRPPHPPRTGTATENAVKRNVSSDDSLSVAKRGTRNHHVKRYESQSETLPNVELLAYFKNETKNLSY